MRSSVYGFSPDTKDTAARASRRAVNRPIARPASAWESNRPGAPAKRGRKGGEELALRQRGRPVARHVVRAKPCSGASSAGDGGPPRCPRTRTTAGSCRDRSGVRTGAAPRGSRGCEQTIPLSVDDGRAQRRHSEVRDASPLRAPRPRHSLAAGVEVGRRDRLRGSLHPAARVSKDRPPNRRTPPRTDMDQPRARRPGRGDGESGRIDINGDILLPRGAALHDGGGVHNGADAAAAACHTTGSVTSPTTPPPRAAARRCDSPAAPARARARRARRGPRPRDCRRGRSRP